MAHFRANHDPHAPRQAPINLKYSSNIVATWNRRFIQRNSIMVNVLHHAARIDKKHIKRDQRVAHPETGALRLIINEKHAGTLCQYLAVHQTLRLLLRIIGNFNRESRCAPVAANKYSVLAARCKRGPGPQKQQGCRQTSDSAPFQVPNSNPSVFHVCTFSAILPYLPSNASNARASLVCKSDRPVRRNTSTYRKIIGDASLWHEKPTLVGDEVHWRMSSSARVLHAAPVKAYFKNLTP